MKDFWRRALQAVDEDEVVRLTRDLIRIPSENPPGDERRVAEYVKQKMLELGMKVEIYGAEKGRPNIIGTLMGVKAGSTLMFNGHMDTVPVGERGIWKHDPFGGEVMNGEIYGRGAADMKGAITSMIEAVYALRRAEIRLKGNLSISIVADGETGSEKGTPIFSR